MELPPIEYIRSLSELARECGLLTVTAGPVTIALGERPWTPSNDRVEVPMPLEPQLSPEEFDALIYNTTRKL
jgi:hypothetical protein